MNVESNDWLDRQLAAKEQYIPDEGFTANVVDRLPKKRVVSAVQVRRLVLAVSGVIAFVLFIVLLVPALHQVPAVTQQYSSPVFWNHISGYLANPLVMIGVSGGMIGLCYLALPILRRMG